MLCRSGPCSFSKFTLCQTSASLGCPLVTLEPISLPPEASHFSGLLHTRGSFCLDSPLPSRPHPFLLNDFSASSQSQLGCPVLREASLPPFILLHRHVFPYSGQGASPLPRHPLLPSPQHLITTRGVRLYDSPQQAPPLSFPGAAPASGKSQTTSGDSFNECRMKA